MDHGAQCAGGDFLAAAYHGVVSDGGGPILGKREGALQRIAHAAIGGQARFEFARPCHGHGMTRVFQQGERGALAGQLGRVGATDAGAIAGHVHAGHAAASGRVQARRPGTVTRVENELAARQAGQLRFGAQRQAVAQGIAIHPPLARSLTVDQPGDARLALGPHRPHAAGHRHAMRAQPGHVVQPLGQQARRAQHGGQGGKAIGEARGIQHRHNTGAGLGVLVGDQIEQGAGAQERDPLADGAALVLQRHLRTTQRVHARRQPARERQHAVGGAGGQDQVGIGHGRALAVAQHVQRLALGVPHQAAGAIVQLRRQLVHLAMQRVGLAMLEAVQRRLGPREARRRLAVDLAAGARRLVQHHRPQALRRQRLRGADAGRTGPHDHGQDHDASPPAASVPGTCSARSGALRRRMPASM